MVICTYIIKDLYIYICIYEIMVWCGMVWYGVV